MDKANFYWTVVVAVAGALWVMAGFIRDRVSQSFERTDAMVSRILEVDQLIIEHPDIAKYMSQTATRDEQYFRSEAALKEDLFFKAKTYAYRQLNSFDEILSMSSNTSRGLSFFKPPALLEISDWETYITIVLRHPLYRSILNAEKDIFGAALRDFWTRKRGVIQSVPADPFIW